MKTMLLLLLIASIVLAAHVRPGFAGGIATGER
jgi:hypothetical protein